MTIAVSGVSNAQHPVAADNNPSAPQPTTLPVNSAAPKDAVTISQQGRQAQAQAAQQAAHDAAPPQPGAKPANSGESKHAG